MNQTIEIIKKRRSIRSFSNKAIDDELINIILEAGCNAPSAHNSQPWFFIVVKGNTKYIISDVFKNSCYKKVPIIGSAIEKSAKIIKNAPVIITVWNNYNLSTRMSTFSDFPPHIISAMRDFERESVAASIQNMWLAATSLGIGFAWLGITALNKEEIKNIFNSKNDLSAILCLGYSKEKPKSKTMKNNLVKFYD